MVSFHDLTDSYGNKLGLYTTTEVAKEFNVTSQRMSKELEQLGIIRKQGKGKKQKWVLRANFENRGLVFYKQVFYDKVSKDGSVETKDTFHMYWTNEGRDFIRKVVNKYDLFNKQLEFDL